MVIKSLQSFQNFAMHDAFPPILFKIWPWWWILYHRNGILALHPKVQVCGLLKHIFHRPNMCVQFRIFFFLPSCLICQNSSLYFQEIFFFIMFFFIIVSKKVKPHRDWPLHVLSRKWAKSCFRPLLGCFMIYAFLRLFSEISVTRSKLRFCAAC